MLDSNDQAQTVVILHRIPYRKVRYHEVIDHDVHNVHYIVANQGADIPSELRHQKILVSEINYIEDAVCAILNKGIQVDTVIALSEYNLIAGDLIRSALGLVENRSRCQPQAVYNCRDKGLMKQCVERAGIRTSQSIVISEPCRLDFATKVEKFIAKPTRGASSENTRTFTSEQEFLADAEFQGLLEKNESFLIEEFVEGEIYHFDGLVYNGEVLFAIGSRYIGTCLAFATGASLASIQLDNCDEHLDWIASCVEAVGVTHGAFHLEGILSDQGMVFLEIANRAGGAGVVNCTQRAVGVNLMQEEVKIAFDPKRYTPPQLITTSKKFGWFVIPAASFNPLVTADSLQHRVPEIATLTINERLQELSAISYADEHNPCTGIVEADNHEKAEVAIHSIFDLAIVPA